MESEFVIKVKHASDSQKASPPPAKTTASTAPTPAATTPSSAAQTGTLEVPALRRASLPVLHFRLKSRTIPGALLTLLSLERGGLWPGVLLLIALSLLFCLLLRLLGVHIVPATIAVFLPAGTGIFVDVAVVSRVYITAPVSVGQDVRTYYMPGSDFTKHHTYKWVSIQGGAHPNQIVKAQIMQAIDSQLAAKGLTKTDTNTADYLSATWSPLTRESGGVPMAWAAASVGVE